MSRHAPPMMGKGGSSKYRRTIDRHLASVWNTMFPRDASTKDTLEAALAFKARMERQRAKRS